MDHPIDKTLIATLIKTGAERAKLIPLCSESQYADIYRRIEIDNKPLVEYVYCSICGSILRKHGGQVSNIRRHYNIHCLKQSAQFPELKNAHNQQTTHQRRIYGRSQKNHMNRRKYIESRLYKGNISRINELY